MQDKIVKVRYANMFGQENAKGPNGDGIREYDITIPSSGDPLTDCETIFRYMNRVDNDPDGVEKQLIALKERSFSVGDCVIIDGETYLCMMAGFCKLSDIRAT